MNSPFPGMDPYLEEPNLWPDVHLTLVIAMRSALNASLPSGFVARADRYVWIHEPDATSRAKRIRPDAFIVPGQRSGGQSPSSVVSAPTTMLLPAIRKEGNKYLKIIDAKAKHLVTVIELLSPGNKRPGPDREAYLAKRIDYLTAGVNLVEFDLLRAGERMPFDGCLPDCDYYGLVCRAVEMPKVDVWPFTIRDPLPTLPIPLLPGLDDVPLDLQTCLARAIVEGRYVEEIDYTQTAEPPLTGQDAVWAQTLLEPPRRA